MEAIEIPVYITALRLGSGAVLADGCLVPIKAMFMDWQLAPGDRVTAYSKYDPDAEPVRAECSVSGNAAVFTPPGGFFRFGQNVLQFEINDKIITLPSAVICRRRLNRGG